MAGWGLLIYTDILILWTHMVGPEVQRFAVCGKFPSVENNVSIRGILVHINDQFMHTTKTLNMVPKLIVRVSIILVKGSRGRLEGVNRKLKILSLIYILGQCG